MQHGSMGWSAHVGDEAAEQQHARVGQLHDQAGRRGGRGRRAVLQREPAGAAARVGLQHRAVRSARLAPQRNSVKPALIIHVGFRIQDFDASRCREDA